MKNSANRSKRKLFNILVVDDEPGIRELLANLLSIQGQYLVKTALDGNDAYSKICIEDFDLILSDHDMPNETGIGLITKAKAIKPAIKTILMTGGDIELLRKEASKLSVCSYVKKPFVIDEILDLVDKTLTE
ncbi:MAG: hypothetical protein A2452_06780 [Candidatus Firestonebacteria bacterium RIFOXYC2_FULL_39_67]|nr:MAG: hypothetical protein A2452_06780 [Candidatus Firestonebacteria bacterium RIFOXYC2_FULL_39_67]